MTTTREPRSIGLGNGWTVRRADDPTADDIPATVPGCVHTDLLAAGVIADPFLDRNELDVAWVADADWSYRTMIHAGTLPVGRDRIDLVFQGLDTLAEIAVDGVEVARTANMHRSYRFDVGTLLDPERDHELTVTFRSATRYAEAARAREGEWPTASFGRPFNYVRKMACSWGWDWGPWLTTAGIWKPVAVEAWDAARLAAVRPRVTVDAVDRGTIDVAGRVERAGWPCPLTVTATLTDPDGEVVAERLARLGEDGTDFSVGLDGGIVRRWWPAGRGDQPRYLLEIRLRDDGGTDLGRWSRRVGFRTVELDTTPDATGAAFTFVVNGEPIFARGVNWIPDDPFPSRITAERYRERLDDAVAANVDMVRVWGGGLYEHEDFYDRCDEVGLLVWQDFLFACAAYPEHLLATEVEAEAREQVERLMSHPSLVLWNGNNENLWGHVDWGWQDTLGDRSWGAGFYFELLPRVVTEVDPGRPYWPGSPYSGTTSVAPNADASGCIHEWEVWNRLDHGRYRDRTPRFVAEFGWQAPPTWSTLRGSISDEPLTPDSPGMLHHQKAADGNGKLERGLAHHFVVPDGIDAWLYATRLNQARAVRTGIEHFRALRGHCMGTIWWQLNDCWPVTSWAVVDSGGGRKPAWYALRDAYAPRLVTIQPRGDRLVAFAVNDTAEPWSARLVASRIGFGGDAAATAEGEVEVGPWSLASWELPARVSVSGDPTGEALAVAGGPQRAWWFWRPDRELRYPAPAIDVAWGGDEPTRSVATVTARSFVRDLVVEVDRVAPGWQADLQLLTLLPGERAELVLGGTDDRGGRDALVATPPTPPVWWSAGHLGVR
ncbi:glycoside hydrolase family 2 protein [Desertimonas flava]|uniref:glycoside hydrolase family 2 protein n=1 Tax=Desertimonas flava TaxID=2064846 RepID=UPI000E34D6CE|nr:glycoside hydrolase family 2 protein [Desertimonas flava]